VRWLHERHLAIMQAHHNNHVFSHQNPYHQQSDWQHHPHAQTQYAQSQAAAAANAVAQQQQQQQQAQQQQQQHYGRMTAQNGSTTNSNNMNQSSLGSRDSALEQQQQQQQQQQHGPSSIFSSNGEQMSEENRRVLEWIAQVLNANTRESALLELSKKREQVPELALILWHSFGVMTSLLQEIISVYPLLNPSQLTAAASNRVCNALALLQCVASHGETRGLFLGGKEGVRHSDMGGLANAFSQHISLSSSTPS